jgi:hypothetical protein
MAWAATRKKGSYFKAQFRRLAGRKGKPRAILAVAHMLAMIIYHLLSNPTLEYSDLREDYLDKREPNKRKTNSSSACTNSATR